MKLKVDIAGDTIDAFPFYTTNSCLK